MCDLLPCLADDEENLELADDRNSGTNSREESSQPSPSSTEQHMEIDAKLADFFKVRLGTQEECI